MTNTPHAPKVRRTLSGKRVSGDTTKRTWRDVVGLAPHPEGVEPKDKPEPPATVDVVMRRRAEQFQGMRRRDARAAARVSGADTSADQLYSDVPTWEVSGRARASRRLAQRQRDRQQRKGQRAFNRQQAAIVRDNNQVEHLIAVAEGRTGADDVMRARAVAALQARYNAKQA